MENNNFKPTVFWAWNGDMTDEEVRAKIVEFARAGIGGVHLHARAGLTIEYLGEEWLRAYKTAIEECKNQGIDVWIYDEQGWPSGFAGGKVTALGKDYLLKYLVRSQTEREDLSQNLVAAYVRGKHGYKKAKAGRKADLYVYYDMQEHYVDLLNPAVAEAFIACTHEVYKKHFSQEFGKTIRGVFTDEPQIHVSSRAWSVAIPERFEKMYGEDVTEKLYLLFEDEGEEYQEFRYRYYAAVRSLFVENYTKRVYEWCEQNGLMLTGHFAGEEGLCVQVASNTGVMPHYEYMHIPGVDHLGRRLNPLLLFKQIRGAVNQFGQKRVLSELFACTGNGVSFRDLAWIWNYHAAFGVNMPCMSIAMQHLGGVRKRDYPVFISSQQPWWEEFSSFTKYMENTSRFVAEGEERSSVLLLSAIDSALEEPIFSLKQKNCSARYRRLAEDLVALQIPYDIGDETLLAKYGKVEGGAITLKRGKYDLVVLPELDTIALSTVRLLEEFSANGGKIVCMTSLPKRVDGRFDPANLARLEKCDIDLIQQRKGILEKYFLQIGCDRDVWVVDDCGKLVRELIVTVRATKEGKNVVVFNPSHSAAVHCFVCAKGLGRFVQFDFAQGTDRDLSTFFAEGYGYTEVTLAACEALYLSYLPAARPTLLPAVLKEECDVPFALKSAGDNLLLVDYARYKFNGEEYSQKMPLVKMAEEIYGRAEEQEGAAKIYVEYSFRTEGNLPRMYLVGETAKAKEMYVNGAPVDLATDEWFVDTDFKRYDISSSVREGENKIVLAFEIAPLHLGFDLKTVHDSVRNKFSYPVDVEAIYLLGDFSVRADGKVTKYARYYSVQGDFTILPPAPLPSQGDLTCAGRWFYAGNAEYEFRLVKKEGETYVQPFYNGAAVQVRVNGKRAGAVFLPDGSLDLTPYLQAGENTVTLTVLGTLRNMLGPHHHFKGETEYTGVHTFTGEYGNGAIEDLSGCERPDRIWTDDYGFIPFGLNRVRIINKKIISFGGTL